MSTIHQWFGQEIAFIKGAPREVLQLCTHILIDGEVRELDQAIRAEILAANDDYARNALRVLAMAWRELPPRSGPANYTPEAVERQLTFIGLAAMMDPPRPEVAEAIRKFHSANIRLAMITGDYGLTAESVARRIGMLRTPSPRILTGAELDELRDDQLQEILKEETIFARMAPDHKLRLVAAYQARGDSVAVIGDGVNDAPALRKSDIGIAMGITGTDVAKQAADVILTDDNFSAIATAVEEGRAVFDNLRKFTTYIFASNVPEIMPFIFMAMFNWPLALTVTQILAIDLGTDLLPALALGTERPEPNVMRRPPRRQSQPLVDRRLLARAIWLGSIETVLCYVGFFLLYQSLGYTDLGSLPRMDLFLFDLRVNLPLGRDYIMATTVFHLGVVAGQIGSAFACRTEKEQVHRLGFFSNKFLLLGIAGEAVIIWILINFKPLAEPFEHIPPPLPFWLILIVYPWIVYILDWLRKVIARSREKTVAPAG